MKKLSNFKNLDSNQYFESIKLNTTDVVDLIDSISYHDLYHGYSNGIEDDEDYVFNSIEDLYSEINFTLDLFDSLDNPVKVYRCIHVACAEDIDYEDLGSSWSYQKESAINFASYNLSKPIYLISAEIDKKFVDWKESFKLHFEFSIGLSDTDENEIYIPFEYNDKIEVKEIMKIK